MPLLRHRQIVADDRITRLDDDATLPASGPVVVSLARLSAEHEALAARGERFGVVLEPTDETADVAPFLDRLDLVCVSFPKFSDGRGYTHARLLRERFGYQGELRAVGEVLGDQLFYMQRCGFDSFELVEGKDVEAALRCMSDFSVTYQPAADERLPLFRRVERGQAAR